jgi:cytidylate kinase
MKKILTLSRELGSGGIHIAKNLAQRLNWKLIDKEVITEVAELAQCPEDQIAKFDQEDFDRLKVLLNDLSFPVPGSGMMYPFMAGGYMEPYWLPSSVTDPLIIDESKYLKLTKTAIQNLADKGNVVIVGRGSQVLLKDCKDALHLRIVAPMEQRIARLMEVANVDAVAAKQLLIKRDKASAEYLQYFYQAQWDNPQWYHLVLNTGLMSLQEAENTVFSCLNSL